MDRVWDKPVIPMPQVERQLFLEADGHDLTRIAGGQSVASLLSRDRKIHECTGGRHEC